MPATSRKIPRTALAVPAELTLAASDQDPQQYQIRLKARSKDVLDHWFWERMVHDFSGLEHKPKIKIDYCHSAGEILGFIDGFEVTDYGLELSGMVISTSQGDRSEEVAQKIRAGVPYEASIEFSHDGLQTEFIPEGRETEVNGVTLSGPLVVFRRWKLTGVAVCPNGYDSNTATEMSQAGQFVTIFMDEGEPMPSPGKTQDAKLEKPASETPATKPETELKATPVDPGPGPEKEFQNKLAKFVERFGAEQGTAYFLGQLSWEDALERHCKHQADQLAAVSQQNSELKAKLDAVQLGESDPVSADVPTGPAGGKSTGLGIKISGRS